MVKLLPIPSLKKVRITKTKTPTKNSPQDPKTVPEISLQSRHDAPERSWSSPIATFATVALKKEMIPWLCTSIASPLGIRPRGRKSSGKSQEKELYRERTGSTRIVLGL